LLVIGDRYADLALLCFVGDAFVLAVIPVTDHHAWQGRKLRTSFLTKAQKSLCFLHSKMRQAKIPVHAGLFSEPVKPRYAPFAACDPERIRIAPCTKTVEGRAFPRLKIETWGTHFVLIQNQRKNNRRSFDALRLLRMTTLREGTDIAALQKWKR
jgi:hypothetical protein